MNTEEKLELFVKTLEEKYPKKQRISLKPYRDETTLYSSKLGGVPYMPKGTEYPVVKTGVFAGKPLHLLVQLNFSQLPHIDGFPESGILQIFAGSDDDDLIGMDTDSQTAQNGFRVLYYEKIIQDESQLINRDDMPKFDKDEYAFPFKGEFLLKAGTVEESMLTVNDIHFEEIAVKVYNSLFGTQVDECFGENGLYDNDSEFCDMMYGDARLLSAGTQIGGYPYFTQTDPRYYGDSAEKYDTLLFQLDSEGGGEDEIMWGDCGIGNFFISSDALKNKNFSDVLYNWDCC